MIHSDWAAAYGVTADLGRETLPVARRMAMVAAAGGRDLPPERRTPGICRDFALMTCSALRERGVPALVRCGFATYVTSNPFEDHRVCEHWRDDESRWVLTDAQLDPSDLPTRTFLNAGEAWTAWRSGEAEATAFGHGEARGGMVPAGQFDARPSALRKQETSDWDSRRAIPEDRKTLGSRALAEGDRIAAATRHAGHSPPAIG